MRARRAILGSQEENCGNGQDQTARQGPKLATGASLLPVQDNAVLPTPANLYSHEPQSGPTLAPSSLGFWVRRF